MQEAARSSIDSSTVALHARNTCAVSVEPNEEPPPVPEELEPNFEDAQEQEEVVNMAPKDMPSPYARDAHRFNSDKPEELNHYIQRLEELFTKHGVDENKDKIRYLGTYADARTEKE